MLGENDKNKIRHVVVVVVVVERHILLNCLLN